MSPKLHGSTPAKRSASPAGGRSTTTHPAATPTPVLVGAGAPLVRGDLATGSITHKLGAGPATLVVDYWTTQPVSTWTSNEAAPVQLSAHLEDFAGRKDARVTRFRASISTGAGATVLGDDSGNFAINPPYAYGGAFVLPAAPASARKATVTVEFDLLIETTPTSHQFFRQTVLDTLNVAFVPQTQEIGND